MTDKKLRKFKLVDKEGYFSNHKANRHLFIKYNKDDIYQGYVVGNSLLLDPYKASAALIMKTEFKYFEEVVDDAIEEESCNTKEEQWNEGLPPVGTECEYSAMDSDRWWDCIFIGKVDDFIYVEAPHLDCVQKFHLNHIHFRPTKPKSWQEELCDEFDIVYSAPDDTFNFERKYSSNGIVALAKRIIELSDPKEG